MGHVISREGVKPKQLKLTNTSSGRVQNKNRTNLFLNFCNYYRIILLVIAHIRASLYKALKI